MPSWGGNNRRGFTYGSGEEWTPGGKMSPGQWTEPQRRYGYDPDKGMVTFAQQQADYDQRYQNKLNMAKQLDYGLGPGGPAPPQFGQYGMGYLGGVPRQQVQQYNPGYYNRWHQPLINQFTGGGTTGPSYAQSILQTIYGQGG